VTDEEAVRAVVLDHLESWFEGDAARMERALHRKYSALEQLTAQDMIEATARGQGRDEDAEDREISIEISDLNGDGARVTCLSHRYVEVLQLVRTPEGWKVLNGIWQSRASFAALEDAPALAGSSEEPRCQSASARVTPPQALCEGRMLRRPRRGRRRR
jgi:hypothetical protein